MKSRQLNGLWISILILLLSISALADIAPELEPDYAEAVLALNSKDYDRSVSVLNELIRKDPKSSEFFEMKALALKAAGRDKEAADVYQALVQSKTQLNRPKTEIAPYAFELGMIRFKEKNMEQAAQFFSYSHKYGFNQGAAKFYLGLIDFQAKQYSDAEVHFTDVISTKSDELKPATHYYLAQCALKMDHPSTAIQSFISARNSSRQVMEDPQSSESLKTISKQIHDGSVQALAPFDRAQFFGNVSALTGYDSNVLSIPTSVSGSAETSGKATVKEILAVGMGYASSPLRGFQFVPSYRGSINKNFNADSISGEFAESSFALFVTRNALSRFSYGGKIEGSILFQNDKDLTTEASTYRRFSHSMSYGPYFKYELSPRYVLGSELFFKPETFALDPVQEELKRSGRQTTLRTFIQNNAGRKYWNPVFSLRLQENDTEGTEFRSKSLAFQLSNLISVSDSLQLSGLADYGFTGYDERSAGKRSDKTLLLQVGASRRLTARWMLLASTDYTLNKSTEDAVFSYSRYSVSAGASYSF